jgi:outer membrane lipoprotein-sorting protein
MKGFHTIRTIRARRATAASHMIALLILATPQLFAAALKAAPQPPSPTVQEVLAKSAAARGGAKQLHAVTSRREAGTLGLGAGNEWPFVVEHKRPNRMRMEIELQGTKLIRAFDGTQGWQKQPQAPAPEQLTGDDLHNIANEADFDNALIDTAAKGKAELLGKESLGGTAGAAGAAGAAGKIAYKVQVMLTNGDVFYYYIDATSYLPIHWEGSRLISGKPVLFESDFSDYRDAGGVKYPFQIVSSIKGSAQKQKITFSKIDVNVPIDDARFTPASMAAPPATAPAPTPPAAAPPHLPTAAPPSTPPPAPPPPTAAPPSTPPPATPPPATATPPPPSPPPAKVPAGL